MNNILNELKRRNVFRVAMTYTIVAWVLVQVSVAIIPAFEAPSWVLKVLLLFIAIGFPLVLVLAWAYELTPEGLKRTSEIDDHSRSNHRVVDSILAISLIVALGLTTASEYPKRILASSAAFLPLDAEDETAKLVDIAVMPFTTLNQDAGTISLAYGLSDNIHQSLHASEGLVVTGFASSIKVTDDQLSRVEIADRLGIEFAVEGSIRINNGDVHVFAQLVALPTGEPLWAAEFLNNDGGLESIQNDITIAVAKNLGAALPVEQIETRLPPAAFNEWLTVLGYVRHGAREDMMAARNLAEGLIDASPGFGPAYAALAFLLAADGKAPDLVGFHKSATTVEDLLDNAVALAPTSPRVQLWRAQCESMLFRWRGRDADLERINRSFDHALEAAPPAGDLLAAYAEHQLAWGETQDAIAMSQRAVRIDPLSIDAWRIRIESLYRSGNGDVAESEIEGLVGIADLAERIQAELAAGRANRQAALHSYAEISKSADSLSLPASLALSAIGAGPSATGPIGHGDSSPLSEMRRLAIVHDYVPAYELAREQLQPGDPRTVLLTSLLAVQAKRYVEAVELFSRYFSEWLSDMGPLRGTAGMQYAPWFAKALIEVGRDDEARRLLDRHLAGLIAVESGLSTAESAPYFAANYTTSNRKNDGARALQIAVDDGLRATGGASDKGADVTGGNHPDELAVSDVPGSSQ